MVTTAISAEAKRRTPKYSAHVAAFPFACHGFIIAVMLMNVIFGWNNPQQAIERVVVLFELELRDGGR